MYSATGWAVHVPKWKARLATWVAYVSPSQPYGPLVSYRTRVWTPATSPAPVVRAGRGRAAGAAATASRGRAVGGRAGAGRTGSETRLLAAGPAGGADTRVCSGLGEA